MYGAVAMTPGVLSILVFRARQSRNTSSELTRICASKSITFWRSSRSKPVITEITRINTVTPSITPSTEISVMIDRNVRFGFKYRSARKTLKGRFNSGLAWRQTHCDSTAERASGEHRLLACSFRQLAEKALWGLLPQVSLEALG